MDTATLMIQIGLFVVGLILLYFGSEWTVRGASTMASNLGVSPMVIGVTIVAIGTSTPEFLVSVMAALRGSEDIALGNVVGSNTANIGLIASISGLISIVCVRKETFRYEIPLFLIAALVLFGMATADGMVSRMEGGILVAICIIFNYMFLAKIRKDTKAQDAIQATVEVNILQTKDRKFAESSIFNLVLCLVGIGVLCAGAHFMVEASVKVAHDYLGISMVVIGLTIVAIGTSLPELAASTMAALRKESDIALGNVLGSNIYNIVLILGVTAIICPLKVDPAMAGFDLPIMLLFTFVFTIFLATEQKLVRWESATLLAMYIGYMVLLYLRETRVFSFQIF